MMGTKGPADDATARRPTDTKGQAPERRDRSRMNENNPFAAPDADEAEAIDDGSMGALLETIELQKFDEPTARFELYEHALVVTRLDDKKKRRAVIPRQELSRKIRFSAGLFVPRTIYVGRRPNMVVVCPTAEEQERIIELVGPLHSGFVQTALQRPLGINTLIAAFLIIAGLPQGELAFNPTPVLLGTLLLVVAVVPRIKPHRFLFIIEALWFSGLAAAITKNVTAGDETPWLLILSLICMSFAVGRVKQYALYAPPDRR